jgi:hypothetical protein
VRSGLSSCEFTCPDPSQAGPVTFSRRVKDSRTPSQAGSGNLVVLGRSSNAPRARRCACRDIMIAAVCSLGS